MSLLVLLLALGQTAFATPPAMVGRILFTDVRLSRHDTVSCASCHDPLRALSGPPAAGGRKAPTLFGVRYRVSLFWDGRVTGLQAQARVPLAHEMGETDAALVNKLARLPEYRAMFNGRPTMSGVLSALASFERTLVSNDAPFDRYQRGERGAMSAAARRGWALFRHRAACIECHRLPDFTDQRYHNLGVGDADLGRFCVTHRAPDRGAFKTPTLRNVALTAPYLHNGSQPTLAAVLRFLNRQRHLQLKTRDLADLEAFLRALTGDGARRLSTHQDEL